ncbi:MAG TPA: hypothetical protein VK745_21430 [Polyangiaceae bacterium]|nr:hypothetical protein [Polyangiaceae bacterium]
MSSSTTNIACTTSTPAADSSPTQLSDACALLALLVRNQSTSQSSSRTNVDLDVKHMQELKQQLSDAIQKAKDAADHSGFFGFLSSVFGSDVTQIAGAVAAVAATIATGGAAGPLILMALSVALEEAAKEGAKLGLDPKICMAIGLASAALGMLGGGGGTGAAASTLASAMRDVELGANVAQGGAGIAGGVLGYVAGHYQAKQLDYQADATGYQARDDATNMDLDSAIALLQQSLHAEQRETTTTSAIIRDNSAANTALSDRI